MKAAVILYILVVAESSRAGDVAASDFSSFENYLFNSVETSRFKALWQQLSNSLSFAALLNNTSSGYTILVPVDDAFSYVSSDVAERIDSLKYDLVRLRSFVTAHILPTMCKQRSLSDCGSPFSASPLLRVVSTIEQAKTWNKLNYQPRAFVYDDAYIQLSAMSSSVKDLTTGQSVFVNGATTIRELQFGSIVVHLIDEVLVERDRGVTAFAFLSPKSVATIQNCDLCKREVRALLLPSGALSRMRIRVPASIQPSALGVLARDTLLNVTAFEALSRLLREDHNGGVTVFFPAEFGRNFMPALESYPDRAYRALASAIVRGHVLFTPAFRGGVLHYECLRGTLEGSFPQCVLRVVRFGPLRDHLLVTNTRALNSLTIVLPNVPLANGVVHFVDGVFVDADAEAEASEFPNCMEIVRRVLASTTNNNDSLIDALSTSLTTVFLVLPTESKAILISVLNGSRLSYLDISGGVKRNQVGVSGLIVRFIPVREMASPYSRYGFSKLSQQEPYEYTLVDLQLVSGMFATFRYLQPDVMCSNGFVHLISPLHSLLRRNSSSLAPSLLALIASRGDLSVTHALIRALELDVLLDAQSTSFAGPTQHQLHTVFAPTDSASFAFLARRNLTIEQLSIVFAKRNAFGRVAQRHVLLHAYRFIGVVTKDTPHIVETQHGQYILSAGAQSDNWFITFNGARSYVSGNDYEAFNGVMHVLEDVLTTPIDFGIAQPAESALRVDVSGASDAFSFSHFSTFAIFHVVSALIVYASSTL